MNTSILLAVGLLLPAFPLYAQSAQDPLNEKEVDQVRDVADQPIERVKLYTKFIEQRTAAIQEIVGDTRARNKPTKLHDLMEEFTRLVDELQDNLDVYDTNHDDVRKALKELVPKTQKWPDILKKPPADQTYDFARKTALEAAMSIAEQTAKLETAQNKWFAEHKKPKADNSPLPPPPKEMPH